MRSSHPLLAALLLLGNVFAVIGQEKKEDMVDCKYFSISVTKGFKVETKNEIDFEIITVSKEDYEYIQIYVGNNPSYPGYIKRQGKNEIEESKLGDVDTISEWKGDKLLRREMKIRLPNKQYPQFLHVSYGDVDKDTIMVSERIVSSLRIKKSKDKR